MASFFGELFRIVTWGESHGGGVGVVVDGCPARLPLSEADIQPELDRRRPGQSDIVTPRRRQTFAGFFLASFKDSRWGPRFRFLCQTPMRARRLQGDGDDYRPSHADFAYQAKYGVRNWQGGGRASARETIGRVAAGAIAKKLLKSFYPEIEIFAYVVAIHDLESESPSGDRDAGGGRGEPGSVSRCRSRLGDDRQDQASAKRG